MVPVIVVADDFGMSPSVNRATAVLLGEGMMTLPSLLVAAPATADAALTLRELGIRNAGLHLNLTEPGAPSLCGRPSALTDDSGCFRGLEHTLRALETESADLLAWLADEIAEQRERLLSFGLTLSHIAGHHHIHVLPPVREALGRVFSTQRPFIRGYGAVPDIAKPGVRPHLFRHGAEATARFVELGFPVTSTLGLQWSQQPSREMLAEDLRAKCGDAPLLEWMIHAAQYLPGEAPLSMSREEELTTLRHVLGTEGREKLAMHVVAPEELEALHDANDAVRDSETVERLRILISAPALPPSSRGNAVTVHRLLKQLRGSTTQITCCSSDDLEARLASHPSRWNLLHGFHLIRTFEGLGEEATRLSCRYVLTQTGTDLAPDVRGDAAYLAFLSGAAAIVFHHHAAMREFQTRYPDLAHARCHVVPKSLEPFPRPEPLGADIDRRLEGRTIVLLPAHIRPVKSVETAVTGFRELLERSKDRDRLLLVIAGRILDEPYVRDLGLESDPRILRIECSRSQMPALYEHAQIVINTSIVEGSPNAVLEALRCGRPVVGRAIPGIRGIAELAQAALGPFSGALRGSDWPIQLFDAPEEYETLADALVDLLGSPQRRERMAANARNAYAYLDDQGREAKAYERIYREATEIQRIQKQ